MTTIQIGTKDFEVDILDLYYHRGRVEAGHSRLSRIDQALIMEVNAHTEEHVMTWECTGPAWQRIKVDAQDRYKVEQIITPLALNSQGQPDKPITTRMVEDYADAAGFSDVAAMDAWMTSQFGSHLVPVPKQALLDGVGKTKSFRVQATTWVHILRLKPLTPNQPGSVMLSVPMTVQFRAVPFFDCATGKKIPYTLLNTEFSDRVFLHPTNGKMRKSMLARIEKEAQFHDKEVEHYRQDIERAEQRSRHRPQSEEWFRLVRENLAYHERNARRWRERLEEYSGG
ncbi:MAG: hypothetical protein AAFP16_09885 [Pseudomonadota bacterium]